MRKIRQTRKIRQKIGRQKGRWTDSQIGKKGKQRIGKGRKEKKRIEQDGQERWMETWIGKIERKSWLNRIDTNHRTDRIERNDRKDRIDKIERQIGRQVDHWIKRLDGQIGRQIYIYIGRQTERKKDRQIRQIDIYICNCNYNTNTNILRYSTLMTLHYTNYTTLR